ncbi:MAG: PQ-loop domain-containing transporter [Gammaproteobacteria bacterium]|jgi:MtN3 and saliva related transmembrane protein
MWETDVIEIFFACGLLINAVLYAFQVIKLYKLKSSEGVSFITFFGFALIQIFTTLHGYIHHDILLTLGTALGVLTCGTVSFQIIYYSKVRVRLQ